MDITEFLPKKHLEIGMLDQKGLMHQIDHLVATNSDVEHIAVFQSSFDRSVLEYWAEKYSTKLKSLAIDDSWLEEQDYGILERFPNLIRFTDGDLSEEEEQKINNMLRKNRNSVEAEMTDEQLIDEIAKGFIDPDFSEFIRIANRNSSYLGCSFNIDGEKLEQQNELEIQEKKSDLDVQTGQNVQMDLQEELKYEQKHEQSKGLQTHKEFEQQNGQENSGEKQKMYGDEGLKKLKGKKNENEEQGGHTEQTEPYAAAGNDIQALRN